MGVPFASYSHSLYCVHIFLLNFTILVDEKQYLIVDVMWIYPMTNNVECFHVLPGNTSFFPEVPFQVLPIFKLHLLSFCYWLVWVLHILWLQILCQTCVYMYKTTHIFCLSVAYPYIFLMSSTDKHRCFLYFDEV